MFPGADIEGRIVESLKNRFYRRKARFREF
jgi:hypothetical protein